MNFYSLQKHKQLDYEHRNPEKEYPKLLKMVNLKGNRKEK